jgi:hypothetical protein
MKKFLENLNGWQRIFIFIVLLAYLPITIFWITEIDKEVDWNLSEKQLDNKIAEFVDKEKLPFLITLHQSKDTRNFKNLVPADKSINFQQVQIKTLEKNKKYTASFLYEEKDIIKFDEDKNVLKTLEFLQEIVDEKSFYNTSYFESLLIVLKFLLVSSLTYLIGVMIGWVVKGFKNKKGEK